MLSESERGLPGLLRGPAVLSTRNAHKVHEFAEILGPLGIEVRPIADVLEDPPEIDETGATFMDNAVIKAVEAWRMTGLPSLADDSGLCVDALDGAPGLFSARWSGGDDECNNDKLLVELSRVEETDRGAHYMCAIALVIGGANASAVPHALRHPSAPEGAVVVTSEGRVDGRILRTRRGANGFGYDPLFYVPSLKKTFAEASAEEKHSISHRGRALVQLRERLVGLSDFHR